MLQTQCQCQTVCEVVQPSNPSDSITTTKQPAANKLYQTTLHASLCANLSFSYNNCTSVAVVIASAADRVDRTQTNYHTPLDRTACWR